MKRLIKWLAIAILLLIVLAGAGILYLQHSASFHRWLLAQMIRRADQATGGRVEIEAYSIGWWPLDADFRGVVFRGTESDSSRPLFSAERVTVHLKILSFVHRRVDFRSIALERPVIHLIANSNGVFNFPKPQTTGGNSSFSIFDLAVKHFVVTNGALYYNDVATPLDADLQNMQAQVDWELLRQAYAGSVSYDNGRVKWGQYAPVAHQANLKFLATRSDFSLEPLEVGVESSRISLRAKVTDYSSAHLDGSYTASVNTEDVARLLRNDSIPRAMVSTNGMLRYQPVANRPFLEQLRLEGQFSSKQVAVRTAEFNGDVRDVRGSLLLERGDLHVAKVDGDIFDGHVNGNFDLRRILTTQDAAAHVTISRVSVAAAARASSQKDIRRATLVGTLNGQASLNWSGAFQAVRLKSDLTLQSAVSASNASAAQAVPLNGEIHLAYDEPKGVLALDHSSLRTAHSQLALTGTLSKQSSLAVKLETDDLHDFYVVGMNAAAILGANGDSLQRVSTLSGAASIASQVSGDVHDPRVTGNLTANNFQIDGSNWRLLRANFDASSRTFALRNGNLEPATGGKIAFDANASLAHWSFSKDSPLHVQLTADQIQTADLQKIANSHYPVSGILNAKLSVQGSVDQPRGDGSAQLSQAVIANESVQNISLQFHGDGNSIHTTGDVKLPAGSMTADVTYGPRNQTYSAQVSTKGIKLDAIQTIQSRLPVSGTVAFTAKGSGSVQQPQLVADLKSDKIQLRDQSVEKLQAHLDIANNRADFTANTQIAPGSVQAKGTVQLAGEYDSNVTLDTNRFPIGAFLAAYAPSIGNLDGQTEIHATLQGPLKDRSRIEAHVQLASLEFGYKEVRIASTAPIRVDYRAGIATLQPAELRGNGTDLKLQGSMPVIGQGAVQASAHGTVDLALLRALGADVESSGQINLNFDARGARANPAVQGEIAIVNAAFSNSTSPIGVEKVNARMQLHGNRLDIAEFKGEAGGGNVNMSGFATLNSQGSFNVGINAQNVRVRYPQGVRAILNGDLSLTGSPADSTLAGNVVIRRLSFTQAFDLTSFISQFSDDTSVSTASDFERHMKLSVGVQSRNDLALASSKVSINGAADLHVQGTLAEPVIIGRTSLTSGEVYFMGRRYDIESGVISFANPLHTVAAVNLNVSTTVSQYNVNLNIVGPIDRLRTTYSSTPALPPADIINLLAFGKTQEEQATSPSTPAALGAESLLAQGLSSQVSGKVEQLAGLSQFEIDPVVGGEQTNPGARLAFQQHITGNLIFSFSTDVTSTQQEVISLEYQTKKKLRVAVVRDEYGGYALNLRLHKDF